MNERIAHLIAFIEAIAAGQPHLFERAVKEAYKAGASREEMLTAVDIARGMAPASDAVVSQAYATVHAWRWLAARRMEYRRDLTRA
jgi:alkylhydroperoxidase/carboxymuconolactone decarboxylase family protein YurZ